MICERSGSIGGCFHGQVDLLHMKLHEILHNRQFHGEGTTLSAFYDLCSITADKAGGKQFDAKANRSVVGTSTKNLAVSSIFYNRGISITSTL